MPRRKKVYRNGKIHVMAEKCATCIFRPRNLMDLQPGRVRQMVKSAVKARSAIICHDTLGGEEAVCRGFHDGYKTPPLQLAEAMGLIVEVKNKWTR